MRSPCRLNFVDVDFQSEIKGPEAQARYRSSCDFWRDCMVNNMHIWDTVRHLQASACDFYFLFSSANATMAAVALQSANAAHVTLERCRKTVAVDRLTSDRHQGAFQLVCDAAATGDNIGLDEYPTISHFDHLVARSTAALAVCDIDDRQLLGKDAPNIRLVGLVGRTVAVIQTFVWLWIVRMQNYCSVVMNNRVKSLMFLEWNIWSRRASKVKVQC